MFCQTPGWHFENVGTALWGDSHLEAGEEFVEGSDALKVLTIPGAWPPRMPADWGRRRAGIPEAHRVGDLPCVCDQDSGAIGPVARAPPSVFTATHT